MFISKTFLPMFWVWKIIWIQAPKTWLGWHEMLKLDTECKWQLDANVGGISQAIYKIPGKTWEGSITSDGVSGIWYLIVLSPSLEIHIAVLLKRKKEKKSHVTQDFIFSRGIAVLLNILLTSHPTPNHEEFYKWFVGFWKF